MTRLKRSREQMGLDQANPQSVAQALLGLSQADDADSIGEAEHTGLMNISNLVNKNKKFKVSSTEEPCKSRKRSTCSVSKAKGGMYLMAGLGLEQRQVIFKTALQTAGKVVDSVWKCALEAGSLDKEQGLSQVVVNQLCSIQSFYCLVVAELGKMCNIVSSTGNELQMKMMQVIVEEIRRLGAAKTAVDLLRLLSTQVDQVLKETGLTVLIGSVTDSLSTTFTLLRSCMKKNPQTGNYQVVGNPCLNTSTNGLQNAVKALTSSVVVPRQLTHVFPEASKNKHDLTTLRVEATAC